MLERDVEKKVCAYAKEKGWMPFKFVSPGNAGVPDRLFLRDGKVIFIEFKAPGKISTPIQRVQQDRIRRLGFEVYVCDSVEDGKLIFNVKA